MFRIAAVNFCGSTCQISPTLWLAGLQFAAGDGECNKGGLPRGGVLPLPVLRPARHDQLRTHRPERGADESLH